MNFHSGYHKVMTCRVENPWWRHQMETFSVLLALCAGISPVSDEFPAQSPVTRSFDVLFDLRLNKRLSKHAWTWWSQTPSRSLCRHCNVLLNTNKCGYFLASLTMHVKSIKKSALNFDICLCVKMFQWSSNPVLLQIIPIVFQRPWSTGYYEKTLLETPQVITNMVKGPSVNVQQRSEILDIEIYTVIQSNWYHEDKN